MNRAWLAAATGAALLAGGVTLVVVPDRAALDRDPAPVAPSAAPLWVPDTVTVTPPPGVEWCTTHCSLKPMNSRSEPPVSRSVRSLLTPSPTSTVHRAGTPERIGSGTAREG